MAILTKRSDGHHVVSSAVDVGNRNGTCRKFPVGADFPFGDVPCAVQFHFDVSSTFSECTTDLALGRLHGWDHRGNVDSVFGLRQSGLVYHPTMAIAAPDCGEPCVLLT